MKTPKAPTTSWKSSRRKTLCCDKELGLLFDACIGDETKGSPISEEEDPFGDIVSIRCRRHKKRFNVEKSWLKTSEWLCPKCYEKLSPSERLCYAPNSDKVEVRPAEQGKPIVYAEYNSNQKSHKIVDSKGETQHDDIQLSKDAIETKCPIDKETQSKVESKKGRKHAFEPQTVCCAQKSPVEDDVSSMFSPAIVALLPSWRMKCQKCGKTVPVHKTYIDNNSSVLCPECFSHMSQIDVEEFSVRHPSCTAELWHGEYGKSKPTNCSPQPVHAINHDLPIDRRPIVTNGDSSDIATGGCYSSAHIFAMTIGELAKAVRLGKVSKARARIEMERRRKSGYYNSLPDVESVTPMLPR